MRSLEEWTKYLDQQEQALEQATPKNVEPERPVRVPEPSRPVQTQQPVATRPAVEPKQVQPVVPKIQPQVTPKADVPQPMKVSKPSPPKPKVERAKPAPLKEVETPAPDSKADMAVVKEATRIRKKLPRQVLATDGGQQEVPQNSYKAFKETREELLQRLLDPQLSLEDAARILNVCPTTVRRYTNRGLLRHYRTAGNQRRFRLSDVMAFMEATASGQIDVSWANDD